MTTSLATLIRLRGIQNKTRKLFEGLNDIHYRLQYQHDLSPAGWYLGQAIFFENYWLHEVIQGNKQFTDDKSLFVADNCPIYQRGPRLPPLNEQIKEISEQQDNNDLLLLEKTTPLSEHYLFKDEYIENLIIQNYTLNYESIYTVLNQIELKKHNRSRKNQPYTPSEQLKPQALIKNISHIKAGHYSVGGEWPYSFDNELPAHQIQLKDFFIANTPVSNAQYLLFIEDGGYNNKIFWCDSGWQWREKNNIQHPEYWARNDHEQWYGINHLGPFDLNSNDAVYGISHFEASAFANWVGARLPHEHEWETAARLELIKSTTDAWEWCCNTLQPYQGFKAFPYTDRSQTEFNTKRFVLKGASHYTRPEIKRASFRNHQQAQQRHIFAGLRLVFD
ncbi:MAG: SUMF1/EgtB/PvdO family nonheme iron enzyme [Gammaproteobacteria bacterium]|nr:SUMF1/EgtB/PvdO family nonheme iron enzyme [Gammaproteobacteria bacterium]